MTARLSVYDLDMLEALQDQWLAEQYGRKSYATLAEAIEAAILGLAEGASLYSFVDRRRWPREVGLAYSRWALDGPWSCAREYNTQVLEDALREWLRWVKR